MNAPSTPGKTKRGSVRSRTSQSPSIKSPRIRPYVVRPPGACSHDEVLPSQTQASHVGDVTLVNDDSKEEDSNIPSSQPRLMQANDVTEVSDDSEGVDDDVSDAGSVEFHAPDTPTLESRMRPRNYVPPGSEETRLHMLQIELAWVRDRIEHQEQLWSRMLVTREMMLTRANTLEPQYRIYADLTAQLDTELKQFFRIASWQFGRQSTGTQPQSN